MREDQVQTLQPQLHSDNSESASNAQDVEVKTGRDENAHLPKRIKK